MLGVFFWLFSFLFEEGAHLLKYQLQFVRVPFVSRKIAEDNSRAVF